MQKRIPKAGCRMKTMGEVCPVVKIAEYQLKKE